MIAYIHGWISAHPEVVVGAVVLFFYHLVSAVIDTMPSPDEVPGVWYDWLYKICQRLAANYSRAK